jgi:hypothetical protein
MTKAQFGSAARAAPPLDYECTWLNIEMGKKISGWRLDSRLGVRFSCEECIAFESRGYVWLKVRRMEDQKDHLHL